MKNLINIKLESDAFRLKDIESLRNLFADLNYEFEDKPADKQNWGQELKEIVVESRIIARKHNYLVFYIRTNSDSIKAWKNVATRIISDNNGFCIVCSHNPSGFQWIFSSLSKEFSKSFSETRHIPIEIKPSIGIPKPFVEFLEAIKVEDNDKGVSILRKISNAFDKFSLQIHDDLTINVFEALKVFSEGIIRDKSNNLTISNEILREIREPIFILLYRIIFVLFAEDRSIFPIENRIYHDKFSLKWIKNNWILKSTKQQKLNDYEIQNRLNQLFKLIELGSEQLSYEPREFFMRSYYGRLFDRTLNSQLEKWAIPNESYIKAIELITTTTDKKGNRFFVDYAALEIRHLGSIYEHLLEYHLTVKNNKIADLPSPQDRKSSGSYYTPQYIVDYIVTNSISPVIDQIIKETPSKSHQIEKILSLNILDPAMGSGHFLVSATEYLAKRICEIENKVNSPEDYVERKRDVVRRCIYGVDINPLAVDLAALSLWLETLSSERPLSFLSAHLKTGNSLIGSKIDTIFENQMTLLESQKGRELFNKNVKDFLMLEHLEDDSPNTVRTKTEKYNSMQQRGTIYYDLKFLLDCKLAQSFGIEVPILGDYRSKIGENSIDFYAYDIGPKIKELSNKFRFFHWELEFPDVFYGDSKKSKSGFDIIIGNPPYVRQELIKDYSHYLENEYQSYSGKADLFVYFFEKAVTLLGEKGYMGLISSGKFLEAFYGKKLIEYLCTNLRIIEIVNFGDLPVFEGISAYPIIFIAIKEKLDDYQFTYRKIQNLSSIGQTNESRDSQKDCISLSNFRYNDYKFSSADISKIVNKVTGGSKTLEESCGLPLVGIKTGLNAAYLTNEKTSKFIKPYVFGRDIKKYSPVKSNTNIIFPYLYKDTSYELLDLAANGKIESLLLPNKNDLEKRAIIGEGVKKGIKKWWQYQQINRNLNFENEYIIYPNVSLGNNFSISSGQIIDMTGFIIPSNDRYILGVLNSKLVEFLMKLWAITRRGGYQEYKVQYLAKIPIKQIPSSKKMNIIDNVNNILNLHKDKSDLLTTFLEKVNLVFYANIRIRQSALLLGMNFNRFLAEMKKLSDKDLSAKEQKEWEEYLNQTKTKNDLLEKRIGITEDTINELIYGIYEITSDEKLIIEQHLK